MWNKNGQIALEVPLARVVKKLEIGGFLVGDTPKNSERWTEKGVHTKLQMHEAVKAGLKNYYALADDESWKLASNIIDEVINGASREMLSQKYQIKTQEVGKGRQRQTSGEPEWWETDEVDLNIEREIENLRSDECEVCGSKEKVQVHLKRSMEEVKKASDVVSYMMKQKGRKQIWVCKDCHEGAHTK